MQLQKRKVFMKEDVTVVTTVDGRNPAPPGMYKTLQLYSGIFDISTGAGFLPSTVVPEAFF